ncbi:MAG: HEAT repeat domain-containing protein [Ignavibacteriales bacterium]|nr:HEAT repeat domain-containing protein [Ignavibacteriales bacterium]
MKNQSNPKSNSKMMAMLLGTVILAIIVVFLVVDNPSPKENVVGTIGGSENISEFEKADKAAESLASTKLEKSKYEEIENNLVEGINSDNRGLQISSAYFLGEMKSHRAINPLLKMLKDGTTEEERIIAALSLSKIKTEQGLFAVKQRIKFDDSERVQRLCEIFYNNHIADQINDNETVEPDYLVKLDQTYNGVKLSEFAGN